MQCASCHTKLTEQVLQRPEGVLTYYICKSCKSIWLDAETARDLDLPDKSLSEKETSDDPCPRCKNIFLESVAFFDTQKVSAFQCRKCRGVRIASWRDIGQHGHEKAGAAFFDFLEGVDLVHRREQLRKEAHQLPKTLKIRDAKTTDYACPNCATPLTRYHVFDKSDRNRAELELCDSCFGIWLDKDDYRDQPDKTGEPTLAVDFESIVPGGRTCPKCRDVMLVAMRFKELETVIDCCPTCFGTWLDGGELQEFCEFLGRSNYDVIDALIDNAVFRQPALCKTLQHFSRTLHELDSQVQEQETNLAQARDIQARLLFQNDVPKSIVPRYFGAYELVSYWQPAMTVGGDYFDIIHFKLGADEYLGICIADVSGKGLPASLLMANFQALLRSFAPTCPSPKELCTKLNGILYHNTSQSKYLTAFYGLLHLRSHRFTYTNAGHNPPAYLSGDRLQWLKEGGTVLGLFPEWDFEEQSVDLNPDDRVLLYTDGVAECMNADEEEFGEERLEQWLRESRDMPVTAAQQMLIRTVKEFCMGRFHDDATTLLLHRAR